MMLRMPSDFPGWEAASRGKKFLAANPADDIAGRAGREGRTALSAHGSVPSAGSVIGRWRPVAGHAYMPVTGAAPTMKGR